MDVLPGNTVNFLGNRVKRIYVSVHNPGPATYAEGKYSISAVMLYDKRKTEHQDLNT
jgi:hypothetical protein